MIHRNSRGYRAAAALVILATLCAAGCKKKTEAEKAAAPAAATVDNSLGGRLNAMSAQAQIDTMRTLVKADSTSAQMLTRNANGPWRSSSSRLPISTTPAASPMT